ncbi:MAG: signal peptidase I [Eubacteriales bacterium]|nr:signal peptidase I [Eubacteriales bacterium]
MNSRNTEKKEQKANNTNKEDTTLMKEILEYVKLIGGVLIVMVLLQTFIVVNARIPSASMEPTIMTGDRVFGNRLAYIKNDPERYDIIIFRYPDDESRLFIKRIIGLPGDTVDIHDGNVYINGSEVPLEDSFCPIPSSTDGGSLTYPFTVPEDSYFVLGDNRLNSRDAREWVNTFVRRDKILGKAVFRYWPVTKMSVIKGGSGF